LYICTPDHPISMLLHTGLMHWNSTDQREGMLRQNSNVRNCWRPARSRHIEGTVTTHQSSMHVSIGKGGLKHWANPTVRSVAAGRSLTHSTRKVNTPLKQKMFLLIAESVTRPICILHSVSLQSDLPETKNATEDDRDLRNPTVSVQSLMQGIELVWSYRSNVPAARGLAGCFSSSMDSGSHLVSRAKQNFWNQ
jgi:hypothetical protein